MSSVGTVEEIVTVFSVQFCSCFAFLSFHCCLHEEGEGTYLQWLLAVMGMQDDDGVSSWQQSLQFKEEDDRDQFRAQLPMLLYGMVYDM